MADNYAYDEDFLSLSLFITRYSLNDKKYKCCTKDEKEKYVSFTKQVGKVYMNLVVIKIYHLEI